MEFKLIRFLIDSNLKLPDNISEKNWKNFCEFTRKQCISNLLYKKLLNHKPNNFPEEELSKLKMLYECSLVHYARISFEAEKISEKLKNAEILFCFLKGYPLSKKFYNSGAERNFEDIDMYIPQKYHSLLDKIFEEEHYSKMPDQSYIEKKPSYIKLVGNHVYMFEIHDNLYTTYFEKKDLSFISLKSINGIPDDTDLFISVLFHHKYFESRLRDFIDLEYIYKKGSVDFKKLTEYAIGEKLHKHFIIVLKLSEKLLGSEWANEVINKKITSLFNLLTFNFILKSKEISIRFFPFKRNFFTKFCDMILTTLIYDDFLQGLNCFINKYLKYVKKQNYFKIIHKTIKAI